MPWASRASAAGLSNKRRSALFDELAGACGTYVLGDLKAALTGLIGGLTEGCAIGPDPDDAGGQTLLVAYPTLYPGGDASYVPPRVKIEAGARSALEPGVIRGVSPYVAGEMPDWPFDVGNVETLAPERTFWEKLLILHGLHCGYRDAGRLPADKDRISRHYYDDAVTAATTTGESAVAVGTGLPRPPRTDPSVRVSALGSCLGCGRQQTDWRAMAVGCEAPGSSPE